jgi:hypothetical protein
VQQLQDGDFVLMVGHHPARMVREAFDDAML